MGSLKWFSLSLRSLKSLNQEGNPAARADKHGPKGGVAPSDACTGSGCKVADVTLYVNEALTACTLLMGYVTPVCMMQFVQLPILCGLYYCPYDVICTIVRNEAWAACTSTTQLLHAHFVLLSICARDAKT